MKTILALLTAASLTACVTTKTTNPDGSTTSVTSQDPKVIKELEPIVEQVGAEAVKAGLDYLQTKGNNGN